MQASRYNKYKLGGASGRGGGHDDRSRSSSTLRMGTVLSTTESSDSGSKVIMKSGVGTSEFAPIKARIKMHMQSQKGCWSLVDPDLEPPRPVGDVGTDPIETTFTEAEIDVDQKVQEDMNSAIEKITQHYEDVHNALTAVTHPDAGDLWRARADTIKSRDNMIANARFNNGSVRSTWEKKKEQRDKREKEATEKSEACTGCWNTCIAPGVLQPYADDITAKKYRKAWKQLCKDYDGVIGGSTTGNSLQLELITFRYNNAYTMSQNIQYIDALKVQLDGLGLVNLPETLNATLINGIKLSAAHYELKAQAKHQAMNKTDYNETKTELKVRYQQLLDTGEIKSTPAKTGQYDAQSALKAQVVKAKKIAKIAAAALLAAGAVSTVALPAAAGGGGGGKKHTLKDPTEICAECGKRGHNKINCYRLIPCGYCKEMGHAEWQCYAKKRKTFDPNDLGGAFADGTSRPK
jgi:hypothetical protein